MRIAHRATIATVSPRVRRLQLQDPQLEEGACALEWFHVMDMLERALVFFAMGPVSFSSPRWVAKRWLTTLQPEMIVQ